MDKLSKEIDLDEKVEKGFKSDKETLNEINSKIDLGMNTEAINQMKSVIESIKPLTESPFKELTKTIQNINKSLDPNLEIYSRIFAGITKQIKDSTSLIRQYNLDKVKRKDDCENLFHKLENSGWVLGQEINYFEALDIASKSTNQIVDIMYQKYSENNFELMLSELDDIVDFLKNTDNDGFAKQLDEIHNILAESINFYDALMPTLFTILQYIYIFVYCNESDVANTSFISEKLKFQKKHIVVDSTYMFTLNEILITGEMANLFKGFEGNADETIYSRHSVLHGKYNPSRYDKEQLIRIIVLMSAICSSYE